MEVRHQARVVGRSRRYLDHRDAHLRREEVFRISPLVRMPAAPAVVLDHQVHLLDPFGPHDRLVLPPRSHRHVLLVNPLLAVNHRTGAAVAVTLAAIGDVAQRPCRRLSARGLLDHLRAYVDRSIPIIHRRRPVARTVRVDQAAFHVVMRLTRCGVVRIRLRIGECDVEQDKLAGAADGGGHRQHRNSGQH